MKCRCGKDHTNDKPVDPQKIIESHANDIARQIDHAVLHMSDKGYQVATLEESDQFAKKRNEKNH